MPYAGRGGAGNIQAVGEANKRIASDLEANRGGASEPSTQPTPSQDEQYARVGRGGAGNFHDPKDLSSASPAGLGDGINSLGSGPIDTPSTTTTSPTEPTRTFGRGGAGNYSSENPQRALRKRLEEEHDDDDGHRKQVLDGQIEQVVNEKLSMPPQARLPYEKPEIS